MDDRKDIQNLSARKFMVWLAIASSFMLVAGLTSVFLISTSAGDEAHTRLPFVFVISTVVILGSSLTLHIAGKSLKGLQNTKFHLYLKLTIALGLLFMLLQAVAWGILLHQKVYFDMHKSYQSFIYVFVAVHLLHIITGIALLGYTLSGSLQNNPRYRILHRLEMSTPFWHFIDILWVYLYLFLMLK
jgi:cytochrome c oxidase subunit III